MANATQPAPLKPLPSLSSNGNVIDSTEKENSQPINPFAKKQVTLPATDPISEISKITLSSFNPPSSTGDFFEVDNFSELEKKPSNLPAFEDEEEEAKMKDSHRIRIEKSLKTNVIIESPEDLSFWQRELCKPENVQKIMCSWSDNNIQLYYRYPDSSLPAHQKKLIHKALNHAANRPVSKGDETLLWYRQFSENWRKALLSAFEGLKLGTLTCLYFVQEGMTVLFERQPCGLKAYMKLSSLALADDFKTNGITYKFNQESKAPSIEEVQAAKAPAESDESEKDSDESEAEHQQSIQDTHIQLKRAPIKFEKRDIYLEGTLALAELVDYLINQKDRNSFAILPEIYAPGPFVYGTLKRNEFTATGACRTTQGTTVYQLRLNGIIFPSNLSKFLHLLGPERISQLTQERQAFTDFLSAYPIEQ